MHDVFLNQVSAHPAHAPAVDEDETYVFRTFRFFVKVITKRKRRLWLRCKIASLEGIGRFRRGAYSEDVRRAVVRFFLVHTRHRFTHLYDSCGKEYDLRKKLTPHQLLTLAEDVDMDVESLNLPGSWITSSMRKHQVTCYRGGLRPAFFTKPMPSSSTVPTPVVEPTLPTPARVEPSNPPADSLPFTAFVRVCDVEHLDSTVPCLDGAGSLREDEKASAPVPAASSATTEHHS